MLLRSKQAPVEISIYQNGCDWDRKAMTHDAKRIADHIPHTASLTIAVTKAASVLDIFSQEILRPAPILSKLSLAYVCGLQKHRGDIHIAPAELFANDTPCLREVSLYNVFIPWSSSLFKGLRSLSIWLPSGLRSPPQAGQYAHFVPALTVFIYALDNVPALQALNVTGALPSFSAANVPLFTMDRKVSLPQLRNLLFGGAILDVALTLSLLAVPSEFNFGLCCTSCDDPIHTMNLFRIVSSHLGTDPIVAYGLSLTSSGFEIWDNTAFKSRLYFVFDFDPFVNGGDTMQQFFAALPQIEVSNIEVPNISLNSSAWQRALKKPNVAAVHTLIFERSLDPLNDVYTLLRPFAGIIADSPAAEGPVLPSLRTLKFIELDAQQMLPVQRSAFLEALESRRTLGLPLEAVVFEQCSPLDGEWVNELKRIVPMVIVDESTY